MKGLKFSALFMSAAMLFTSCDMTNTAKGGLIGGGGGGALGALIGSLAGGGKGAAIGAAVGTAVGAGAGVLIGNKMDKAKKAAEMAQAEAEIITTDDGAQYVKATFASGLLFMTGKSNLSYTAAQDINNFVTNLKYEDTTYEIVINGYTDNQGWRNCNAAQSQAKNVELSESRARAVQSQIIASGYPASRIIAVNGYGEANPVADNSTAAGREQNRRVEVFILPSKDMINAANAASQN